jgi:hypothetical protein
MIRRVTAKENQDILCSNSEICVPPGVMCRSIEGNNNKLMIQGTVLVVQGGENTIDIFPNAIIGTVIGSSNSIHMRSASKINFLRGKQNSVEMAQKAEIEQFERVDTDVTFITHFPEDDSMGDVSNAISTLSTHSNIPSEVFELVVTPGSIVTFDKATRTLTLNTMKTKIITTDTTIGRVIKCQNYDLGLAQCNLSTPCEFFVGNVNYKFHF